MQNMTGRSERLASTSGLSPGTLRIAGSGVDTQGRGRTCHLHLHLDLEDVTVESYGYSVYDETGLLVVTCAPPPFPFGATPEQALREFRRHLNGLPRELRLPLR